MGGVSGNDVFLYDRVKEVMTLVSHADGLPLVTGNVGSRALWISTDSRYVGFASAATNLLPGQIDPLNDVFVYDRVARTTVLEGKVTTTPGGSWARHTDSFDGHYTVFVSSATDLVPNVVDANGANDVFLLDNMTGAITLVSHSSAGPNAAANGVASSPSITGDGRYIAYATTADDVIAGQLAGREPQTEDVFVYDRVTGSTVLVSHKSEYANVTGNRLSNQPSISATGDIVLFKSLAADLVDGLVTGSGIDFYAYDITTGTTKLVTRRADDLPTATGDGPNAPPHGDEFGTATLSDDGRIVAWLSGARDLVSDVENPFTPLLYVRDRLLGTTTLVNDDLAFIRRFALSGDGRYLAFDGYLTELMPGVERTVRNIKLASDRNVFLYDRVTETTVLVSHLPGSPLEADGGSVPMISKDGSVVAYYSQHRFLLYDRELDTMTVATAFDVRDPSNTSRLPQLSADGRYFAYESSESHVYLYDRETQSTTLVSHAPDSPSEVMLGREPRMSDDGRYVVFTAPDSELLNAPQSVLVFDRESGFVTRLGGGTSPEISGNGEIIVFYGGSELRVIERATNASRLIVANGLRGGKVISGDGRFLLLSTNRTDVVPGVIDANGSYPELYVYDLDTDTAKLVSHRWDSELTTASWYTEVASISGDGRSVVFQSQASDLVFGDYNGFQDVFLDINSDDQSAALPLLTVVDAAGNEDTAIPLHIDAALGDTDGSEFLSAVTISGVPDGAVLSAGTATGVAGEYTVELADLAGLTITPPENDHDDFVLGISVTSTETSNYTSTTATALLNVTVDAVNDPPQLGPLPDVDFGERRIVAAFDLDDYYSDVETPAGDAMFDVVARMPGVYAWINPVTHVVWLFAHPRFEGEGDITIRTTDDGDDGAPPESAEATFHVTVGAPAGGQGGHSWLHFTSLILKLYLRILHRNPDLDGWTFWCDQMADHGATAEQLGDALLGSAERIDPIVQSYYRDLLGRDADEVGLVYWRDSWRAEGGPEQIVAGILGSQEYFINAGGTPTAWLGAAYQKLLNRDADAGGLEFWRDIMTRPGVTRAMIVHGFLDSGESHRNEIYAWYQSILGRDPNENELAETLALRKSGATTRDLVIHLLTTDEFALLEQ